MTTLNCRHTCCLFAVEEQNQNGNHNFQRDSDKLISLPDEDGL